MQRVEGHRPLALVETGHEEAPARHVHVSAAPRPSRVSLLRLSVPGRLIMVAIASALLWGAVFWALR